MRFVVIGALCLIVAFGIVMVIKAVNKTVKE